MDLFAQAFLGAGGQLVVEGVCLLQQLLADAGKAQLGIFGSGALHHLVSKVVEQVYGFIDKAGDFIRVLSGIYVQEKGAVIDLFLRLLNSYLSELIQLQR